MLPIHTILHATDFSVHSDYALRLACSLARDYGARLVVLHVSAPPVVVYGSGIVPPEPETHRAEAREQLEQLQVSNANVRTERRLEEGEPAEEILRVANEIHANLLIMGTHGRTGLQRLLMGSVAEEVVRQASCPVLTVKTPFPSRSHVSHALPQKAQTAGTVHKSSTYIL
jgi:nucleotide-binding universal stress UspA family protein